jgi:hypothetical protein
MPEPTSEQWEAILTLADREIKQSGLRKELIANEAALTEINARKQAKMEVHNQTDATTENVIIYEFQPELDAAQAAVNATKAALEASKVPGQIEP